MAASDVHADFASAYREHVGWVLQAVGRLGVRGPEREDVAHDVFATAWQRLDTYERDRPMRPWLFGIAFRLIRNRNVKRSGHEPVEAEASQRGVDEERPDTILEGEAARTNVLRALDSMPMEQRALFVGHDIEETPIVDLARELDVPLSTAYSRLRLARQRFQTTYAALQNEVRR